MELIFFADQHEFRKWLEANHQTEKELQVGYYKKSSAQTLEQLERGQYKKGGEFDRSRFDDACRTYIV